MSIFNCLTVDLHVCPSIVVLLTSPYDSLIFLSTKGVCFLINFAVASVKGNIR